DGVLHGLDALDYDGAVPDRAQPLDVAPRERRVELRVDVVREGHGRGSVADLASDDVGEADRLAADERHGPSGVEGAVDDRPQPDGGRKGEPAPDVALAPSEHRG